ncbi:Pentatricopeptide repeat-containing protein [Thalictrum thalictroides]|uniref:Pentatricopeptide repeat-containing protein n=1 Tax=Thalictrum thalictroides TaxID=46969 RepID=A0A7J6WDL2_THATH|nr:Pentatricopeptide repeat-containing protein [Thalictrum thalictroides]
MCDVHEVFENMPVHNLTSWDTMITGLAKNGHGEDAIDLFTRFKQSGLRPDGQMFMGVFMACSVVCDIDEGMLHFESMSNVYGIVPSMEHYTSVSVVRMLGSIRYLDEAMEFIEKIPFEPTLDVWETLMDLCRLHGNIVLED